MKVKLLKIEVDDVDGDGEEGYAPSGVCTFEVNKKTASVIVHSVGELDFEGDELTEEESDALLEAFESSAEVNKAFPPDLY